MNNVNRVKKDAKLISLDTAVLRKKDITTVDFDGELALMDVNKGVYYYMDSIGSGIWEILKKPTTTDEIVQQSILQYDIDEETCRNHVLDFIEELIERDLVLILK